VLSACQPLRQQKRKIVQANKYALSLMIFAPVRWRERLEA